MTTKKIDYKRELHELYGPRGEPVIVDVPDPFQSGRIEASAESPRAAVLTHDAGVVATPTARAGARSCNTLFRSLEYLVRLLR
jgi:hypothetical protein